MTVLGLLLILLGWILQLIHIKRGQKIHILFLFSYCAGVGFLVMDNFFSGNLTVGVLNCLTLCVVMLLLLQFKR